MKAPTRRFRKVRDLLYARYAAIGERKLRVPPRGERRRIAVVVPCFNQLPFSSKAVNSVLRDFDEPHEFVLIVIDDSSCDGTREYFRTLSRTRQDICYVRYRKNMGVTQAWNDGARIAIRTLKSDFVYLVNSDVIISHGALGRATAALDATPDAGVVGVLTNRPGHQPQQNIRTVIPDYRESDSMDEIERTAKRLAGRGSREIPYVNGFFMGFRCDVLEQHAFRRFLGPWYFDPNYRNLGNEDELQKRMRRAGLVSVVAMDAFVYHYRDVSQQRFVGQVDPHAPAS